MTTARQRKAPQVPTEVVKRHGRHELADPYGQASAMDMLVDAAEVLDKELDEITQRLTDDQAKSVTELAEEMLLEDDTIKDLEAQVKQHKDRYNEIRTRALPDKMRELGLVDNRGKGSFTFAGGKVHLETRLSASCAAANKPQLFEWLKLNGAGDLVKPDVHQATLTAFVKERRLDQLADPPGLSIWEETKAKLTKVK